MTVDAPDVDRSAGEEPGDGPASGEPGRSRPPGRTVAVLAAALLGAAFLGASAAGVIATVGPYLLGVSALSLGLALVALGPARRRYSRSQ